MTLPRGDLQAILEIEQQISREGGPFATEEATVLGERFPIFRDRAPSLRAFVERSAAFGDAEYLVFGERRLSFADHRRAVASVARGLEEKYGVGKGDRVAIVAANCVEWILTFWATVSLGAVVVGLNGWWAGDEIEAGITDTNPKVLFGDRKRLDRLRGARLDFPVIEIESGFEALWHHAPDAELPTTPIAEDDPAVILYSSGTTGRSKGVVSTHRNIVALTQVSFFHGARLGALAAAGAWRAPSLRCQLSSTPLFHVSGLYSGVVNHLAGGVKSVWTEGRFDALDLMKLIERERVSGWAPMGAMAYRVVNHPERDRHDLSSIRTVGCGGAPVTIEIQRALRESFPLAGPALAVGYGLTEGTGLATMNFGEELQAFPGSSGRPMPTVDVVIRDAEGRPLRDGEEGEITLRGPLNMLGYWNNPEATRAAFWPGRWLRTGDIGRMVDGRIYIDARRRDLILRGAENVYPIEIENRLAAHPGVKEVAVIGVPSVEFGQEVKAVVVPREGVSLDAGDLGRFVAEKLAYFKVPTRWEIREEPLPRNATNKVTKYLLDPSAKRPFLEE